MNQRITIKKPNQTADGFGGQTTDFIEYGFWADVQEQAVNKVFADGSVVYGKRFTMQVRNGGVLKDLTQEFRIKYRGKDLEIASMELNNNRSKWTLVCEYAN